ncbi:MAG: hypothetical protein CSA82_02785 [Actinobacteria bacterium]|nr:MAG: hypothetical protein CSA82_02785 [Actinomycetota bacterium]
MRSPSLFVESASAHPGLIPHPLASTGFPAPRTSKKSQRVSFWENPNEDVVRALHLMGHTAAYSSYDLAHSSFENTAGLTLTVKNDASIPSEGYVLTTRSGKGVLSTSTAAGAFYGALTLGRALQCVDEPSTLNLAIVDKPRFQHRGIMIDVARSFLPFDDLLGIVDAAASLKLNILHLHLVDDQGWRLEVTNEGRKAEDTTDYTALHRVGSMSACSAGPAPGFDVQEKEASPTSDSQHSASSIVPGLTGYYTRAQLRELISYAAKRHVEIIPEIEFPGHNHVVLHALPHLASSGASAVDEGEGVPAWTRWQVGESYLDFTIDETWHFAEHVLRQTLEIFGPKHVHLGGDEAFKMLKKLGKEAYDQTMSQLVELAHSIGFDSVTLWQEGVLALSASDCVQLWDYREETEVAGLIEAAKNSGCHVINSNAHHAYLDQKINLSDELGLTWACPQGLSAEGSYIWNPVADFPAEMHQQVIGVEACLWSETVRGAEAAAYMIFPRLLAIAEVAWSPQESRNWNDFASRSELATKPSALRDFRQAPPGTPQ